MTYLAKLRRHGVLGSVQKALLVAKSRSGWYERQFRQTAKYEDPSEDDLEQIERDLRAAGINVKDYEPDPDEFRRFEAEAFFPIDYHGGLNSGVWDEKLLEHWIAASRLGLMSDSENKVYVDFAAATSPWAQILRERLGIEAFAIDIGEIGARFKHLSYYKREDATRTSFADESVDFASLQCAYEMFMGQDDTHFINELSRVLRPGGKAIIVPLYMHTHYCAYSTPEYFGKGYSDTEAHEYVRLNSFGVPSSRKYDAVTLKRRVLDIATELGMRYNLFVLRNKRKFGPGVYCHFILELIR